MWYRLKCTFVTFPDASAPSHRNNKDPEIVGEFLLCLKIMQYSAKRDPGVTPLVDRAKRFLLNTEKRSDGKPIGEWKGFNSKGDKHHKRYLKYHAAYCVAVGLVEFESDFANADPPRPIMMDLLDMEPTL